ncbi:Ca2+:Cation Antiporter (CaCA) Family [Pseudoloma neurophilia]|uniref:Ca2+:Cation Antiporter (CaCA) Family n=1 Tax=Pseudoloma neurophilia TaxID=146866 RepID=A0A0R0MAC9_9MICR|nr:Ca2+:Cation Antiporter (CaCA) Family [Pseudoloma neurophilia]
MENLISYINSFHSALAIPLLFILTVISILLSIILTDEYLLRFLNMVTQSFSLRSEIVAILLINLGNGLPELITSLLLTQESKNIKYALYCAAGGQVTLLTAVLGATIFSASRKVFLNGKSFYKNLLFLLVSTIALFVPLATFDVTRILGGIMLIFYFSFLFYSLFTKCPGEQIEVIDETSRISRIRRLTKKLVIPIQYFFDLAICEKGAIRTPHIAYFISVMINLFCFSMLSLPSLVSFRDGLASKIGKKIVLGLTAIQFSNILVPLTVFLVSMSIFSVLTISNGKSQIPILIYNIFMSILWIYFTSQMIIDVFNVINLDKAFISMVLLPIGNSLSDLITNCIGSHKGLVRVGLTASMTSPIHNTLLNLGLTFFLMKRSTDNLKNGNNFIFDSTKIEISQQLYFIPLTITLITLFILSFNFEIRNRKLESECGAALFSIYALYLILVSAQIMLGDNMSEKKLF